MDIVNNLLGTGDADVEEDGNSMTQWLLNLTIGICGLFLILSYEASVTALLVEDGISDFRTLDDLKSCRIGANEVCLARGDVLESVWKNTIASQ